MTKLSVMMAMQSSAKQQGATLIVALVLLAIVTIVGIAGMRGTNLEMKMIASARDRAIAFEAAESALRGVEQYFQNLATPTKVALPTGVITNPLPDLTDVKKVFAANCLDGKKGFCFRGLFDESAPYECKTYNPATPQLKPIWEDEAIWENASLTETVKVDPNIAKNGIVVRYIVEFMCFTLKRADLSVTVDDKNNGPDEKTHEPIYRITALAEGSGGRSRVMAQSIVKINLPKAF
ncbi:pilus assembly PilX family protein [Marinagarivorans algicola]|uniref:pilus assembly PilX family protein n=1 Tax=Marinagarivorans algicola TaxID=1513270 RepID=UPI00373504AC